jgi:tetratricopeptide (TPR) repeat protein
MTFARLASPFALALVATLAAGRAGAETTAPAPSSLDVEARDLFRSQRYPEALAIYQRLRTETHHPTYLRNIGRCHQMMRQPEPAIAAFEAYLREAPTLDAAERTEIEGYISEMRRLRLESSPPPERAPAQAVTTPAATDAGRSASAPITRRWWFWTGLGVVLATGILVVVSATSGTDRLPCPAGAVCP